MNSAIPKAPLAPPPAETPLRHWLDAWHVKPSANRDYEFIDGLRGLALLMVMGCHYLYFKEHPTFANQFVHALVGRLAFGVSLFFTLSGFLISWPFWKRKARHADTLIPAGYARRRFWKIYPALALSILMLTPVFIMWQGEARLLVVTAVQWLLGIAFIVPVSGKLNPVMWSLVVEIHFYAVLPLLFLLTRQMSAKTCLAVIGLLLFAVPVLIQALTGLAPVHAPQIEDPYFTGLSSFCLGVTVAGLDALKLWSKRWYWVADAGWLLVLVGLLGSAWVLVNPAGHAPVTGHLFEWVFNLGSASLLFYAVQPENPRARWLCTPWLRWCGIISYECYLFHQPLIYFSRGFFGPTNGGIGKYFLVIGVPLVASLALAAVVYRWFSPPILKFGRSRNPD